MINIPPERRRATFWTHFTGKTRELHNVCIMLCIPQRIILTILCISTTSLPKVFRDQCVSRFLCEINHNCRVEKVSVVVIQRGLLTIVFSAAHCLTECIAHFYHMPPLKLRRSSNSHPPHVLQISRHIPPRWCRGPGKRKWDNPGRGRAQAARPLVCCWILL